MQALQKKCWACGNSFRWSGARAPRWEPAVVGLSLQDAFQKAEAGVYRPVMRRSSWGENSKM